MYLPNQTTTLDYEKTDRAHVAECIDLARVNANYGSYAVARALLNVAHKITAKLPLSTPR